MIHGIGTDILNLSRIAPMVALGEQDPFIRKTYTSREIALISQRQNPLFAYGTRFAGKEAVFKAMGIHGNEILLSEIEILELESGEPMVHLSGNALAIGTAKKFTRIHLSLSYDTDFVLAYALIESE